MSDDKKQIEKVKDEVKSIPEEKKGEEIAVEAKEEIKEVKTEEKEETKEETKEEAKETGEKKEKAVLKVKTATILKGTSKRPTLKAEKRKEMGRKKMKKMRREGLLPASVYGKGFKSLSIQLKAKEAEKLLDEVGEVQLVNLEVTGEKSVLPVLFRNPQYDPVQDGLLHVDFYKVDLSNKITAAVPVEYSGESPAVIAGKVLITVADEVEVEALPEDLPEKFVVYLEGLVEAGQTVTAADLKISGEKAVIKSDENVVLVKIEEPRVKEEEEVKEEEAQAQEGEAPAEGEKKEEDKAEETPTEGEKSQE